MTSAIQRLAALVVGGVVAAGAVPVGAEEMAAPKSEPLVQPGWEQAMFPGAQLEKQEIVIDESLRSAVMSKFGVLPPDGPVEVFFVRDAAGKLAGGLLRQRISYLQGRLTLAVGLNSESRIAKVVIPDSDAIIHADVHDVAPRGIVTRYTVASLPQLKQIAASLQDREGLGRVVAQETLRAAATLKVLIDQGR